MRIKLFTHGDLDGCGCALVICKTFGRENVNISKASHNNVNEDVLEFLQSGEVNKYDIVFITDISVKDAKVIDLINEKYSRTIVLLDHHKTALELNRYSWCTVKTHSDNGLTLCGTNIVLQYCVAKHKPDLVNDRGLLELTEVIRMYDTWDWKPVNYVTADKLSKLYFMIGRDEFLDTYMDYKKGDSILSTKSKKMLDKEQEKIDKYVSETLKRAMFTVSNKYKVCVVYAESYINELADAIKENFEGVDICVIINLNTGRLSFRTSKKIDLTGLAKLFKGGGHPQACGGTIPKEVFDNLTSDIFKNVATNQLDLDSPNPKGVNTNDRYTKKVCFKLVEAYTNGHKNRPTHYLLENMLDTQKVNCGSKVLVVNKGERILLNKEDLKNNIGLLVIEDGDIVIQGCSSAYMRVKDGIESKTKRLEDFQIDKIFKNVNFKLVPLN